VLSLPGNLTAPFTPDAGEGLGLALPSDDIAAAGAGVKITAGARFTGITDATVDERGALASIVLVPVISPLAKTISRACGIINITNAAANKHDKAFLMIFRTILPPRICTMR